MITAHFVFLVLQNPIQIIGTHFVIMHIRNRMQHIEANFLILQIQNRIQGRRKLIQQLHNLTKRIGLCATDRRA